MIESYCDFKVCKQRKCSICAKLSHDIKLSRELKEEKRHRIDELVVRKGIRKKRAL